MTVTEAKEQLDELYTHRTMVEMEKDKLDWVEQADEVRKIDGDISGIDESINDVLWRLVKPYGVKLEPSVCLQTGREYPTPILTYSKLVEEIHTYAEGRKRDYTQAEDYMIGRVEGKVKGSKYSIEIYMAGDTHTQPRRVITMIGHQSHIKALDILEQYDVTVIHGGGIQ